MTINTSLLIVQWNLDGFNLFLYSVTILLTPTVFVMVHNHSHLPMWKSVFLNRLTDLWQTAFYGYPVFAWVPTHVLNHHKYTNQEGDYTSTNRLKENNLLTLLAYPFISIFHQSAPIRNYLKEQWNKNRKKFYYCVLQYVFLVSYLSLMLSLNVEKTFIYVIVPQLLCLTLVLMINYVQHAHTNENSQYNHSRNFIGMGNKYMLNNGLHTAHHKKMSCHWSKVGEVHESIKDKIDKTLLERSMIFYFFRVYLLAIFVPKFRSKPISSD